MHKANNFSLVALNADRRTLLHSAAQHGSLEAVKSLLSKGVDVTKNSDTVATLAALHQNIQVLKHFY